MGEPAIPSGKDIREALDYATHVVENERLDGPRDLPCFETLHLLCNVFVLAARGAAYPFGVYRTEIDVDDKLIAARLAQLVDFGAIDVARVQELLDKADSPRR